MTGTAYKAYAASSHMLRVTKFLIDKFEAIFGGEILPIFQTPTTTTAQQSNSEKLAAEKPAASRMPPLLKPSDSVKPFDLQRSYTTLDKSTLDSSLYSDEPQKVSLASLIDDDNLVVPNDLYNDADRILSQDAGDSVDTENELDILAHHAMHIFPLKNDVNLFRGDSPIHHHHSSRNHLQENNYTRAENGYYKSPHKRRAANQNKRQAPVPSNSRSPKVGCFTNIWARILNLLKAKSAKS